MAVAHRQAADLHFAGSLIEISRTMPELSLAGP